MSADDSAAQESRAPLLRRPLTEFIHDEATGGVVLVAATIAALVWANAAPGSYEDVWSATFGPSAPLHLDLDLHAWVNDAAMALFFFAVGLEIKRELIVGELADRRAATMPVVAALGGMVVPALIYLALNAGSAARDGWGVPMATDIAFVMGALSLLGGRAPSGLRLFLLAVAIVDDLGAIAVIAVFYSAGIKLGAIIAAVVVLVAIRVMQRVGVSHPLAYLAPAVGLWSAVHESGIHATIAGVALGLMTPARPVRGRCVIDDLLHRVHPISALVVVPLFALANAGVRIDGDTLAAASSSAVAWGIALGLIAGKTIGITGAALLASRLRLGVLPSDIENRHLLGGAALAGIGFTVALFIAELSFAGTGRLDEAKLAILTASAFAAALGALLLVRAAPASAASE